MLRTIARRENISWIIIETTCLPRTYKYVLKTNASLIVWLRALSHETFSGGRGGSGTEVKIQDAAGFLGVKSLVGKGLIIWMPGSEQMILTITSKICFYTSYLQPKMKIALFYTEFSIQSLSTIICFGR